MANENQNKKIVFSGEKSPYDIISEILEKHGFKEDIDDAIDKIEKGEISKIEILYKFIKDFIKEKISEKELISLLEKQLGTTLQTAENIVREIKEKVLPYAEKITAGIQTEGKKPITAIPTRLIDESKDTIKKSTVEEPIVIEKEKPIEKKTRVIKNIIKPKEIKETENISKKSDSYREPIE